MPSFGILQNHRNIQYMFCLVSSWSFVFEMKSQVQFLKAAFSAIWNDLYFESIPSFTRLATNGILNRSKWADYQKKSRFIIIQTNIRNYTNNGSNGSISHSSGFLGLTFWPMPWWETTGRIGAMGHTMATMATMAKWLAVILCAWQHSLFNGPAIIFPWGKPNKE